VVSSEGSIARATAKATGHSCGSATAANAKERGGAMMSRGPTMTQEQFIAKREAQWREETAQAEKELRKQREQRELLRKQRVADVVERHAAAAGGISEERANKIVDILHSAMDEVPEISRSAERGLDRLIASDRNGGVAPFDWNEGERPATANEQAEMAAYARWLAGQEATGSEESDYYKALAAKLSSGLSSGKVATVPDVLEQQPPGPNVPGEDWHAFRGRPAELWQARLEKARATD
jgi:hypothetical protein